MKNRLDNVFLRLLSRPHGTVGTLYGPTVRSGTMRGRKVSDETARIVRELRRQGLSLRQIERRTGVPKSTVFRLTEGIPWELDSLQPRRIGTEATVTDDGTEWASGRTVTFQVPRWRMETDGEDRPWIRAARAYAQTRLTSQLRSRDIAQEQHAPVTVQTREESELDEAEALLRRTPRVAKLYQTIDIMNLGEAMRSEDPLGTYRELRRKALAPAVRELLRNKMRHSQTA
jgi:hypothetical protein